MVSAALLALLLFQQGAAVADDPHQSALAAYRRHQYAKAAELFEKAVAAEAIDSRADREIEVSHMLGNAYIRTRQAGKVVTAFATMFGFATNSAAAHLPAAQFTIRQEFEEDAGKELAKALDLPRLQRAIWLNLSHSGPHILLGKAYFNGELANAEGMLRRALAIGEEEGRQMRDCRTFLGPAGSLEV